MLHNLEWLKQNEPFPPVSERSRIERYKQNLDLFNSDHFALESHRTLCGYSNRSSLPPYDTCARRISKVVGNFRDVISFPTLLNYQRLMTLKMADLVCGEYPTITVSKEDKREELKDIREIVGFDEKLYEAVIDISRYGEAIQRIYLDPSGEYKTFTNWEPSEWFPIVSQDGTRTILKHVLCWRVNESSKEYAPAWRLHVQIHGTTPADIGFYEYRKYTMDSHGGAVGRLLETSRVPTGLESCAVRQLKAYSTTNTIYGYDDYMPLDSILSEIMTRVGQISVILDKHADPNITGPTSMLSTNPATGELYLETGKFFAVSPGEQSASYMVWEGQLEAAFKELELLINQLYILSEMGSALLGSKDGSSQAISSVAMRFKMINPLAKARRIANSLTRPTKSLFAELLEGVEVKDISIVWSDGLPDNPREIIELIRLATGREHLIPLEAALAEYLGKSDREIEDWMKELDKLERESTSTSVDQDDDVANPLKKGSKTGLSNFSGVNNIADGR